MLKKIKGVLECYLKGNLLPAIIPPIIAFFFYTILVIELYFLVKIWEVIHLVLIAALNASIVGFFASAIYKCVKVNLLYGLIYMFYIPALYIGAFMFLGLLTMFFLFGYGKNNFDEDLSAPTEIEVSEPIENTHASINYDLKIKDSQL